MKIEETKEKAISELKKLRNSDDVEMAHIRADEILCELLNALGCEDVVDVFEDIDKWYS